MTLGRSKVASSQENRMFAIGVLFTDTDDRLKICVSKIEIFGRSGIATHIIALGK